MEAARRACDGFATRTTDTPVIEKFGFNRVEMPIQPIKVEQCVREGLNALQDNRTLIIPGRVNRIMNAVVRAFTVRSFIASSFEERLRGRVRIARRMGQRLFRARGARLRGKSLRVHRGMQGIVEGSLIRARFARI